MNNLELRLKELAQTTVEFLEQRSTTEPEVNNVVQSNNSEFTISFIANTDGDLIIKTNWPTTELTPSQIVAVMSVLLHRISNGDLKPVMVQAIQSTGIDKDQGSIAQEILEQWGTMVQTKRGSALCVDPTEVFKG